MSETKKGRKKKGLLRSRYFYGVLIIVAMFAYLISGLVRLQLINGEEYAQKA